MKGGHRGGSVGMGEPKLVDTAAAGRELHQSGKSIARRSQWGLGLIGEPKLMDTAATGRELHQLGKSIAQRSRRSQRDWG